MVKKLSSNRPNWVLKNADFKHVNMTSEKGAPKKLCPENRFLSQFIPKVQKKFGFIKLFI